MSVKVKIKPKKKNNMMGIVVWWTVVILATLLMWFAHEKVSNNLNIFTGSDSVNIKAKVVEIISPSSDASEDVSEEENSSPADDDPLGQDYSYSAIQFKAEILSGEDKGKQVTAEQATDDFLGGSQPIKEVEVGDQVILTNQGYLGFDDGTNTSDEMTWNFVDYYRFNKVILLAILFFVLILLLGRAKGFNALLALMFTFSFIFFVFVPSVLNGYNPYLWTIITCAYTIITTLLLVNGLSQKTFATIIGCLSGTIFAALLTLLMSHLLHLTGFLDEHSIYITMLNPDIAIDLSGIVFAAITIGAMGAIMDVAMDISSSLWELSQHVPNIKFTKLFNSGMSIGRDIMGTMANTLVLAYIGSSLSSFMLMITYSSSLIDLLNREAIITELLQALIGSIAILLTIPLTILVCGFLYINKNKKPNRIQ